MLCPRTHSYLVIKSKPSTITLIFKKKERKETMNSNLQPEFLKYSKLNVTIFSSKKF